MDKHNTNFNLQIKKTLEREIIGIDKRHIVCIVVLF